LPRVPFLCAFYAPQPDPLLMLLWTAAASSVSQMQRSATFAQEVWKIGKNAQKGGKCRRFRLASQRTRVG
jgi:hypothetical protein